MATHGVVIEGLAGGGNPSDFVRWGRLPLQDVLILWTLWYTTTATTTISTRRTPGRVDPLDTLVHPVTDRNGVRLILSESTLLQKFHQPGWRLSLLFPV